MIKHLFTALILLASLSSVHAFQNAELQSKTAIDLYLFFDEIINDEVHSADKLIRKIKDVPASVKIITRDDIERYGYMNLEEALKT